MKAKKPQSTLFTHFRREIYVFGDDVFCGRMKRMIDPLSFLTLCDLSKIQKQHHGLFFLIAEADFLSTEKLGVLTKYFRNFDQPFVHKVLYMTNPQKVKQEHMLFSVEVGARFMAQGEKKDREICDYLRRVSSDGDQIGTIAHYETEMNRHISAHNLVALNDLDAKLTDLDRNSEEVLRLRAIINAKLRRPGKVESFLKRILSSNPQNLWAANELGRLYIERGQACEGLAILEKMSRFHDLNGERFVDMGEAYLNLGDAKNAQRVFDKGSQLANGTDARFEIGKAKAKLLQGNVSEAMKFLKQGALNDQIISFLNMRGILSVRSNKTQEGVNFYKMALENCRDNPLIKAKLNFNLGLGFVKSSTPGLAADYFAKSIELGGDAFRKAKRLMEISRKLASMSAQDVAANKMTLLNEAQEEEFEFEYEHIGVTENKSPKVG